MADGLLNKASIILTPTGYKAGTLYNVAPVVEPYEDFDFARASVASRVNSSGLVEMVGRTLGSELVTNGDFATDSDWNLGDGWSIVNGEAVHTGSGNYIEQGSLTPGNQYKVVIVVTQADNVGFPQIYMGGLTTAMASPDTYTFYITAQSGDKIKLRGLNNCKVASVSVKEIIDTNNIPRISYDSNGDNGHILLEPTSTNLITYSEDFSNSSWTKSNVTITSNSIISPDGSLNASLMTISGGASDQRISSNISYSGTNTVSIFAKASNSNWLSIRIGSSVNKWYDLENGVLGGSTITTAYVDADIQDFGNGWYRCILVFTENNTLNTRIYPAENNLDVTHTTGSVYIWGCQAEALSYATSYIPSLTGSTETRATETATGAGSADLINSTEGVLYAEIAALVNGGANRYISLSDNTTSNRLNVIFSSNADRLTISGVGNIGSFTTINFLSYTQNVYNKIAIKYSSSGVKLFVNGSLEGSNSDNVSWTSNTLTTLDFSLWNQSTAPFEGKVKALAVFNEALSDSELTQLTT